MKDAWRLAVGTLTAIPVKPPRHVDRNVAGPAMALAPMAITPIAILVGLLCWAGDLAGLASPAVAVVAVGVIALATRALHLDGLADTADGLTASYDRERSLEIMRTGDVGPAGAAALVLVLGVQAASIAALLSAPGGPVAVAVAIIASRGVLVLTCSTKIRPARADGLGRGPARSVPPRITVAVQAVVIAVLCVGAQAIDLPWWRGLIAGLIALAVVALLLRRVLTRLGGVTGDVFGAAIEIAFAAILITLT